MGWGGGLAEGGRGGRLTQFGGGIWRIPISP